jgi:RES domain-containing protein
LYPVFRLTPKRRHTSAKLPRWDSPTFETARKYGNRWYDERRTCVMVVPSVVTLVERNILINEEHPDFPRIRASDPIPVHWDDRLWEKR